MPSQADEEAHQLSYLQKHLANILSLLAEPVEGEGEGEESLVCETYASFFCYFCLFYLVHTKLYAVQVDFSATMFHFLLLSIVFYLPNRHKILTCPKTLIPSYLLVPPQFVLMMHKVSVIREF